MPKHKENCYEVSKEQAKYMSSIVDTRKTDRFMLELQRMPSEAVNIENCVEACEAFRTVVERVDFRTKTDRPAAASDNRIYENLAYFQNGAQNFKFDLELDNKTLILNKFFRSTERNYAAYENLCNGCGYGVFEARGSLCNFCQYVVHGAYERLQSGNGEEDHHSNGNIYENICEKCGTIYSSEECECQSIDDVKESIPKSSPSIEEHLDPAEALKKARAKKKRSKRSLFYGLIGSLRRTKSNSTPPQTPSQNSPRTTKRLEIVHNVEGYDNVFRTQESFDLEKICELKRSQNSCSDQHIYGRLKARTNATTESLTAPTALSQSYDQLGQERWPSIETPKQVASADCISGVEKTEKFAKKANNGKRPRISKARLLRSLSQKKERKSAINENAVIKPITPEKQALYLADNVCQWMTSLRREIHTYQSFGLADDIASCDPKSIPARNTLSYGQIFTAAVKHELSALVVTNSEKINVEAEERQFYEITKVSEDSKDSIDDHCNWNGIVTLRRSANDLQRSPVARSRSQQMVQDFKRNLMSQQRDVAASPTSTATSTSTSTSTPSPTMKTSPTISAQQRAKRQAIYLKLDDTTSKNSIEITKTNNNNNNHNNSNPIHSDAQVNYTSKRLVVEAASKLANDRGLASRCFALQPITAPNKRCGIYERDSEFVNDILSAFEQFLQRETDIQSDNATLPTEVVTKCELTDDQSLQSQLSVAEQSTTYADPVILNSVDTDSGVIIVEGDRVADLCDQQSSIANVSVHFQADSDPSAFNQHRDAVDNHCCNIVQPFAANAQSELDQNNCSAFKQIFNPSELIDYLLLSRSLNKVVIYYDKQLSAFLRCLRDRVEYREKYSAWSAERLVRKFQRFANSCQVASSYAAAIAQRSESTGVGIPRKLKPVCESVEQEAELAINATFTTVESENNLGFIKAQLHEQNNGETNVNCFECQIKNGEDTIDNTTNDQKFINAKCHSVEEFTLVQDLSDRSECRIEDCESNLVQDQTKANFEISESEKSQKNPIKPTKPPVPQRDPATCITQRVGSSPPRPIKRSSPIVQRKSTKMTVPTPSRNGSSRDANSKDSHRHSPSNSIPEVEEDIYQPIWKFKTVGEVQERYHTDADYYEFDSGGGGIASKQFQCESSSTCPNPMILISNDVEDHSEWETDDEFMFTTQLEDGCPADAADSQSLNSSTVRSTRSGSSITGSTVTGFGSSTMTIASAVSASLMHPVLRNIGIYFSLTEPKLRAIIYDYDRVFATSYFAKRHPLTPASSDLAKTMNDDSAAMQENSPIPPPRTTSALKTRALSNSPKIKRSFPGGESGGTSGIARTPAKIQLLPDSVQAWKFMLLDVNYLEDEEDMIVSETEILRAQEPKDDIDARQNQQLHFLQRFKSASIGNLIDIPTEEDKKSITERMRNKLQRGVFKLNVRSPKSEKKSRGLFRRAEATSLYLEDGMKPKYPIFGAPLDQLELNQTTQPNVPRFVVDSVEYIERKDCITQDGLYRASGNKVSVDELKQKLSESYIYDPKLLVCDDIHTLTSLLKQFFRELGAPLIPQDAYERLGRNLTDDAAIETMRIAFDEMREPNRSTLKFLIKHLTNVASYSSENRMPASNLAIVWGPCILSANQIEYDIARMNTLAKVLIENHDRIFRNNENERLVS